MISVRTSTAWIATPRSVFQIAGDLSGLKSIAESQEPRDIIHDLIFGPKAGTRISKVRTVL